MSEVVVEYGCHNCLQGYDVPTDVADPTEPWVCPHCDDGFGAPMPAAEQPTVEARKAVAWSSPAPLAPEREEA